MDDTFFESLLNARESETLDFKSDYYFANSNEKKKSELLKDVLAFANSQRDAPAFILVGVEETKGGRSIPKGVREHLISNQIQQFINEKTSRRVKFSVYPYTFQGVELDIIQIEVQEDMTFAKYDYGIVRGEVIYTRVGDTTATVPPNEIYKFNSERLYQSKLLEIALNGSMNFELDTKGAGLEKLRLKHSIHIQSRLLSGPIINLRVTLYKGSIRVKRYEENRTLHLGEPLIIHASTDYPKFNHNEELEDVYTITFGGDNSKLYYSRYTVGLFCNLELDVSPYGPASMVAKYYKEISVQFENKPVDTNNIFE